MPSIMQSTRGRQHFTICHEFYHLFYDENPTPHLSGVVISDIEKKRRLVCFRAAYATGRYIVYG